MPNVNGQKFPYTAKGQAQAALARKDTRRRDLENTKPTATPTQLAQHQASPGSLGELIQSLSPEQIDEIVAVLMKKSVARKGQPQLASRPMPGQPQMASGPMQGQPQAPSMPGQAAGVPMPTQRRQV